MTTTNTNKITIQTAEGTATIDAKMFRGYWDEAFELLREQEDAKNNLKGVVEVVADATGLKKTSVNKFFKARFADKLAAQSETSELFELLDEILA